ncbi:hypothetical protein MKW94_009891 [Papaver nudicaule]|uniref:SKP1-like protein n=1 Tax=Papaver nudicaule TaxID=74823 RepID=A0AA41W3C4_PAPNU|nr:hypothetical protein [Papaver nudicaule]
MASSSSPKSPPESQDVEIMLKKLHLEENVEENLQESATGAASSSSVLVLGTPKSGTHDEGCSNGKPIKKPEKKTLLLSSYEGDVFEIEESSAMLSEVIKHMIEDDCAGNGISLPNITTEVLEKVIVFLEKHGEIKERDETEKQELIEWDKKFIKDLEGNKKTLYELVLAADYLSARCLLDVACQAVADMIKVMSPEEIRKEFNIKNDFTPEEEEEARRENAWAFEE